MAKSMFSFEELHVLIDALIYARQVALKMDSMEEFDKFDSMIDRVCDCVVDAKITRV